MISRQRTIGQRIGFGFGVVLVLLAILAGVSFMGVGKTVNNAEQVIDGNKLDGLLAQKEVDHLNWANQLSAFMNDDSVTELAIQTDHTKCAFGQWLYGEGRREAEHLVPSLGSHLKEIEEPHRHLHESAVEIRNKMVVVDAGMGGFLRDKKVDHLSWTHEVKDAFLHNQQRIEVETDASRCSLGKWMASPETREMAHRDAEFGALLRALEEPHRRLHASAIEIQEALNRGQADQARDIYMNRTEPAAHETLAHIDDILAWHDGLMENLARCQAIYARQTLPALSQTQGLLNEVRQEARSHIMTDEAMLSAASSTQTTVGVLSVVAIIAGIALALWISRALVTVVRRVSKEIMDGADQVVTATSQVSASSQGLAEGASQQAASLEETSSSLEEMASITKQNAQNANQADKLMGESKRIVTGAGESMRALNESMNKISQASEETQKIIKTIDEIAFQTNLLALNAAVEAARAGEAGAGFAVVADEVRNLAMRAADAAKNTASLIEGTVKSIGEGQTVVKEANESFEKVSESTAKVGALMSEIAAASNEQSSGIDQVNRAVTEMDKVTQQSAANAEELASASEEMSAQAHQTKSVVEELLRLAGQDVHSVSHAPRKPGASIKRTQPKRQIKAKSAVTPPKAGAKEKNFAEVDLGEDFTEF